MSIVHEEWRDVLGFAGKYEVSSLGHVRPKGGDILAVEVMPSGYCRVKLWKDGRKANFKVHRLVAKAFLRPPQPHEQVDHIDGNKANNRADNLEWVTGAENRRRYWSDKGGAASEEQVRVAMALVLGGWGIARAAERVGRNKWWLRDIYRGETWKHLRLTGRRNEKFA